MRIEWSRNKLGVRGVRKMRCSVLGGWQSAIVIYVPRFSVAILYGKVSRQTWRIHGSN